jgi:GNAT superfamily N-acetyltransferase
MQTHYEFDPRRFLAPGRHPEAGYASFLAGQLEADDVVVFVAEMLDTREVVGYAYAGLEPRSWKELRDAAGFVHDVAVDPGARRTGAGTALLEAAIEWLREQGAPRVMLWTATQNHDAQRVFARLGFRPTMTEMTLEL